MILKQLIAGYSSPEKLKIRDESHVESLLQEIINKGPKNLQLITDFDCTLTKYQDANGVRCSTSHGIIGRSSLVPDEFRKKSKAIYDKYYPLEIDHNLTVDQKIPFMEEWYEKKSDLLPMTKITRHDISEMVKQSHACLRDGSKEVLRKMVDMGVPILVFSAGVGDVLEEILIQNDAKIPNIKVVSNYIEYDDEGYAKEFKRPLIHAFNKNETALEHGDYFDELKSHVNALVLGDSLGDVGMDKGMPREEHGGVSLKIGFLDHNIDERLESFLNNFDIVLLNDDTFEFISLLLALLEKGNRTDKDTKL